MTMVPYNVVLLQQAGYVHALGMVEIGRLLYQSFRSLGVPCRFQANQLEPDAINVLLGYHRINSRSAIPSEPFVVYQLEQLSEREGAFRPIHLEVFHRAQAVWDYSKENIEFLKAKGVGNVRHLPIGYHPALETIEHREPEHDVLFYGSINERRRHVLERLAQACKVKTLFGVYGAQRDRYVARSKIVLNIHFYEAQVMEQVRLSYLLNNRCFVVSESSPVNPFGESIVTAAWEDLVPCVLDWLARPDDRQHTAERGYRMFQSRPMSEFLRRVIDDAQGSAGASGAGISSTDAKRAKADVSPPDAATMRPVRVDQPLTSGPVAAPNRSGKPAAAPVVESPASAGATYAASPLKSPSPQAAESCHPARSSAAEKRTHHQTTPTREHPPMHQSSYHRMSEFASLVRQRFGQQPIRLLDIGSKGVNGTYRELFADPKIEYVGLDVEPGPNVDLVPKDPYDWQEIDDESFDVIISGQVLEHLEFPWLTMEQIARKLKPGGLTCLIAPSRGPEHRFPVDCFRYYPDGMQALARWSGLSVLESDCVRGASGFQDGSDQWGDCYCVLSKNGAQALGGPERSSQKPCNPGESATAGVAATPTAATSLPLASTLGNRHRKNPLNQPKVQNYYEFERNNVITSIQNHGIQAKRILELGCSAGATGRRLKEVLGADHYVGIEICEEAAEIAKTRLDEVHVANVEETPLESLGLKKGDFDLVLALDVLEHLYNPWEVLAQLTELLRPEGHAVLSIPNVQNITLLNDLINGRWPYQSAGLLDVTHLRFFTFHEIGELVTGAGLSIVDMTAVLNPNIDLNQLKETGNNFEVGKLKLSNLSRREVGQLFTYQYLVTSRRAA